VARGVKPRVLFAGALVAASVVLAVWTSMREQAVDTDSNESMASREEETQTAAGATSPGTHEGSAPSTMNEEQSSSAGASQQAEEQTGAPVTSASPASTGTSSSQTQGDTQADDSLAFAGKDRVAMGAAAERLALRAQTGDAKALQFLLDLDYGARPEQAAPVIAALAKAAHATPQRDAVASELARRLPVERARDSARESKGNTVLLLEALERIGSPVSAAALCQHLATEKDAVLQDATVRSLARTQSPEAASCIENFVHTILASQTTSARGDEAYAYAVDNALAALASLKARSAAP